MMLATGLVWSLTAVPLLSVSLFALIVGFIKKDDCYFSPFY